MSKSSSPFSLSLSRLAPIAQLGLLTLSPTPASPPHHNMDMADAPRSHNSTVSPQNTAGNHDAPCSTSAQQCAAPTVTHTTATADLSLRQAKALPVSRTPKVHDITEKFMRACKVLEVGQLIKDDNFTLFESIGAIEIMDPKMDSGFLGPGETLEDDYDTLSPLLPEELVGIMDQLLCHEMAWHTGYPLSQTLFTSVYIDKLLWPEVKTLEQAQFYRGDLADNAQPGPLLQVLRAYCLAVILGCDFVIARVTSRDYFEEEDFCTHTYNRVLFTDMPLDVFLRELDAAMEIIQDTDLLINDALRAAILARLEYRKFFLQALDIDLPLNQIKYSWSPVLDSLKTLQASHELGKPVPGACTSKLQRRLASTVPPRPIVHLSFADAVIQLQSLVSDCAEATRFIDIPHDPLEYQSFLWYFASRSPAPLAYARSYLATFLFHEEVLQSSVSPPLGDVKSLVLVDSPLLDPSNWALSPPRNPSLPKHPRLQFALLIDEFIERAGQAYLDLWVCLGQNRCRLRRMLTHVITGWDLLQADAALIDNDIANAAAQLGITEQIFDLSLSTWVYVKKLWMIEKVIILGFEQDIYLPDEYASMYLFLSRIATRRCELVTRIQAFHQERRTNSSQPDSSIETDTDNYTHLSSLVAESTATATLASSLSQFYTILLYLHLLPQPRLPAPSTPPHAIASSTTTTTTTAPFLLRHELRMKPFLALQPPEVPSFADLTARTQPYGPPATPTPQFAHDVADASTELWATLEHDLRRAKAAFAAVKTLGCAAARARGVADAWATSLQCGLASCVALGVAVAGVKREVCGTGLHVRGDEAGRGGLRVEIPAAGQGLRYAEGWVVVRVTKT